MFKAVTDFFVQNSGSVDEHEVLNRRLFEVNMRLYKGNEYYHCLIDHAIRYMIFVLEQGFEDYSDLRGISAANLGIPWNIIVVTKNKKLEAMINPKIIGHSNVVISVTSNCASLLLPKGVPVDRWSTIDIEYYDRNGKHHTNYCLTRNEGGFTIQHELSHGQGILVTTRKMPEVAHVKKHRTVRGVALPAATIKIPGNDSRRNGEVSS